MNHETQVSEFILFSLSEQSLQRQMFISLSFSLYLIEHVGNYLTILVIISDPYLHSSMYFLLSNLSLLDIFLTTTTIFNMLVNPLCGITIISFSAYLAQMDFLITFGTAKSIFLSVMTYDCYLAICYSLHYMTITTSLQCALLMKIPWIPGNLISMVHTILMLYLSFCFNLENVLQFMHFPQQVHLSFFPLQK